MIPNFIEKAPYEKGFTAHYDAHIRPVLEEVEAQRVAAQKEYKRRNKIAFIVDGLAILAFILVILFAPEFIRMILETDDGGGLIIAGFIALGAPFAWASAPLVKFKKGYKNRILPVICKFYGQLDYKEKNGSMPPEVLKSGIYPSFTKQKSEDYITGKYKDTQLSINELKLKKKSGKKTYTVFKGLSIVIQFPKSFNGVTLLRRDKGKIGNWFESSKNMERVELEDPKFEAKFEVHSTDQIEARYLLTTAFMERLMDLAQAANGTEGHTNIQAIFKGSSLMLAVPSKKNLFEPESILKSAFDLDDIHTFLKQMNEIFLLIDLLKLDRN